MALNPRVCQDEMNMPIIRMFVQGGLTLTSSTDHSVMPPWAKSVFTIEQARDFVLEVGSCSILSNKRGTPALWDAIAAPDKQPGETGWGERMELAWRWKNELPALYPTEIFYGKRRDGAMLCSFGVLSGLYEASWRPVEESTVVAQRIFSFIAQQELSSRELRLLCQLSNKNEKAIFDKALLELQLIFQIVRVNRIGLDVDMWTPFDFQYPELGSRHRK